VSVATDFPELVTVRAIDNVLDKTSRRVWDAVAKRPVWDYVPEDWRTNAQLRIVHSGLNGTQVLEINEAKLTISAPGDEILLYIVPAALPFIPFLILTIAMAGISAVVSALSAPTLKDFGGDLEESPTYGWDAISNTVRPGTPVSIVYGTHRVGGHIIQQHQREARNGDAKTGELNTLIAVCSGPIDSISDVRVDKNPIASYGTAIVESHVGNNRQACIEGFNDTITLTPYDREILFGDTDDKRISVTTVTEVDSFEAIFRFPGGLCSVGERGQYEQKSVKLKVEYRECGTDYWILSEIFDVQKRTQNSFDYYHERRGIHRSRYDIRVTRMTPDDSEATGTSVVHLLAVNECLDDLGCTYPRIALFGVRQLPTNQISGSAPEYDCLVKGKKVRIFTDLTTYTVAWSDNPSWCTLDFLTNPFDGLGTWVKDSDVDIQSFIDWAAFCDILVAEDIRGILEKQFRLNIVLDGSMTAIEAIHQMCVTGRANFMLKGTKWSVRVDKPEEPVQLFTMGRIHRDTFSVAKTSRANLANYFVAQFWNESNDYEQDSLPLEDSSLLEGAEQMEKTVNLVGTTKASQANRLLLYYMLSSRLSRRVTEFEVGTEALMLEAGDVFKLAHDVPGWGQSGILLDVDSSRSTLILDRDVTIESGKIYELTVIHDTDAIDVVYVTSNPATTNRIQVSGEWSTTPARGTHYSFGEVERSTVLYRCISITRASKPWLRKIRATQYDVAIYGTDLTVLPDESPTWLPDERKIPPDVRDLRLVEREVYAEDGTLSAAIDVHFTLPAVAMARAQIFWRTTGQTAWEPAGAPVDFGYFSITQEVRSPGASYEISVVTLSGNGNRKHPDDGVRASITTTGTLRRPDNVVGFIADRTLEGLVFSWQPIDEARNFDLAYYEIRQGPTWDTAIKLGQTKDTTLATIVFVKGTQTFLLKAFNTAGRNSPRAAQLVMLVDGRIGENVVFNRQEDNTWTGHKEAFTVNDGTLLLQTTASIVAWLAAPRQSAPLRSQLVPGGYGSGFRMTGTYTTDIFAIADEPLRSLVATELEASQLDVDFYWTASGVADKSWDSDFARARKWGEVPEGKVAIKVEMRFSTASANDSDFGPWQERAQNIEVLARWAQVRIIVTVTDPAYTARVTKLRVAFDVPDVVEGGSATTSVGGTVAVAFAKAFNAEPKISCTVIGATAGDEIFVTAKSKTGFTLSVKNGGTFVTRTVNYTAVGY